MPINGGKFNLLFVENVFFFYPALYHACYFGNIVNCYIILNFVFAASYKGSFITYFTIL